MATSELNMIMVMWPW